MGPPLEALSPPGALGRRHPGAFRHVGSNGLTGAKYQESEIRILIMSYSIMHCLSKICTSHHQDDIRGPDQSFLQ